MRPKEGRNANPSLTHTLSDLCTYVVQVRRDPDEPSCAVLSTSNLLFSGFSTAVQTVLGLELDWLRSL